KESFEHLAEAGEEPGADQPDDLALVRLLPAALEQLALEEPRETQLVGQVFDLGCLALADGGVLGQLLEVSGRWIVRESELPQQRPVHDEVGIAPDRRGEMAVGAARESRMAEVVGVVARLLQRAQDERGKGLAAALRTGG